MKSFQEDQVFWLKSPIFFDKVVFSEYNSEFVILYNSFSEQDIFHLINLKNLNSMNLRSKHNKNENFAKISISFFGKENKR